MGIKFVFLFIMIFINCSVTAFATGKDYIFNPKDAHHSMYLPEGNGPFPAVLLLHASTGIEKVNHEWGKILKDNGYVVYIIDSFKPRGWLDRLSVGWEKATAAQLDDVTPAYRYLTELPFVDVNRIGLLGFSMGGFSVLRVMDSSELNPTGLETHFKASASFYGVCHRLPPQTKLKGNTTIFIGEDDDRAKTNDCEELIQRSNLNMQAVNIVKYKDALHGFDNSEFPPRKELIDEKGERYHIGYNKAARELSIKDLLLFFNKNLKTNDKT